MKAVALRAMRYFMLLKGVFPPIASGPVRTDDECRIVRVAAAEGAENSGCPCRR